jgi:uroporphyrinogen decarboxylase
MRDQRFLRACRGEPVDTTPIWLMRQAGRYLPEYRALRAKHDFLTLCRTPELAVEVTLQPLRRYELDAAILFSDILIVFPGMGLPIEFAKGEGPVIDPPIRDAAAVRALRTFEPAEHVPYVLETLRLLRRELPAVGGVPVIGFSGAPFTLASYAIEGGGSKNYHRTKALMYAAPDVWDALMSRFADTVAAYLEAQIEAGAQAVQLFDTWVGALAPWDYARYAAPYTQRVVERLTARTEGRVPVIHYAGGTTALLKELAGLGADVLSVDWRIELDDVLRAIGADVVLQGNLEPAFLYAPTPAVRARAAEIVAQGKRARGHVFNLGHGIHPDVDPGQVAALVDAVHEAGAAR